MDVMPIIDAVIEHLRQKMPELQVEYFPERPEDFRLNHPIGAVLLSYVSSKYAAPEDVGMVLQPQAMTLCATVVVRQLNGRNGAVAMLDIVRKKLGGYHPPNCRRAVYLQREQFIGEVAGLWQYALEFATETVFVEDREQRDAPPLAGVQSEETV